MKSRATRKFWAAYRALPEDVRARARSVYPLFHDDAKLSSLRFKKVHDQEPVYSVRVTLGYRALGLLEGDEITWFWIGGHQEFKRLPRKRR